MDTGISIGNDTRDRVEFEIVLHQGETEGQEIIGWSSTDGYFGQRWVGFWIVLANDCERTHRRVDIQYSAAIAFCSGVYIQNHDE